MTKPIEPISEEDAEWLDDLERCDGHCPCGDCDRCTEGGQPWREARAGWLAAWNIVMGAEK